MASEAFQRAHVSEIPLLHEPKAGEAEWKPVRHHFGIDAFGVNAVVARGAGDMLVGEHVETDTRHEELYLVVSGHAVFTIADEEVDAPASTLVFVPDPDARRAAVALEAGTTVLAFGATPDVAFTVSDWERKYTGG